MTYAPQSKESSNSGQQQSFKATAQTFTDERESTSLTSSLQMMMANSPQQQKLTATAQRMANSPVQQRLNTTAQAFAEKPEPLQRAEDEEPLQGKFEAEPAQREAVAEEPKPNNTGLPDNLKSGIESLSGMSMDHVKVHYNSDKPAQLQAHAYAQGSEIHVASGQEQHLPHEAWHVVQQAQGRVKPTLQMKAGVPVNDDAGLEAEADLMGEKALVQGAMQMKTKGQLGLLEQTPAVQTRIIQRLFDANETELWMIHPIRNRPALFALLDQANGIYRSDDSFAYDAKNNVFTDPKNNVLPDTPAFDENKVPGSHVVSASHTLQGIQYTVDSMNRPIAAEGQIVASGTSETGRSGASQQGSWKHVQPLHRSMFTPRQEFNGGHIIAHHMGGSPGTSNMVPMQKEYNQSGEYKQFEQRLDTELAVASPLSIKMEVDYAADADEVLDTLVVNDAGNKKAEILADPQLKSIVYRVLGRIPVAIRLVYLRDGAGDIAVAGPASPMDALKGTIAKNYNVGNLANTKFKTTKTKKRKGAESETSDKEYEPLEKLFGPNKGKDEAIDRDYHSDYLSLYKDLPEPGVLRHYGPVNGYAGGLYAYVRMDPMGIMNRFGGSETQTNVDPLGTNWAYFADSKLLGSGKGRLYVKGHLLNAQLHGSGVTSANLIPLTSSANTTMSSQFEEKVKESEALVDPRRGIFWQTIASPTTVNRPGDWGLGDAQGYGSGELWTQESNMASVLHCRAWEAVIVSGIPKQGRLILSVDINNVHTGDAAGTLGKTISGAATANQLVANPGNPNHAGVPTITHTALNTGGLDAGYQLDFGNQHLPNFSDGVANRGYDDGFANQKKQTLPAHQGIYDKNYLSGQKRQVYLRGYFEQDNPFPTIDIAKRQHEKGQFNRGYDDVKGGNDVDVSGLPLAYQQGKAEAMEEIGYRDGRNLRDPNDSLKDNKDYENGWVRGIRKSGDEDGYTLEPQASGYSVYIEAFTQGRIARGEDDGEDLLDAAVDDGDYLQGWERGLAYIARREAESGLPPKMLFYTDHRFVAYHDAYDEAYQDEVSTTEREAYFGERISTLHWGPAFNEAVERGKQRRRDDDFANGKRDGYDLRFLPFNYSGAYEEGYYNGLQQRAYDDGRTVKQPAWQYNQRYMHNYEEALGEQGYQDGQNGYFRRVDWKPYAAGYQQGIEIYNAYQDGYHLRWRNVFGGTHYHAAYDNGIKKRGYQDGYELRAVAVWSNPLYQQEYQAAQFARGRHDAEKGFPKQTSFGFYLQGYNFL